jgi:hypothetical protein
VADPPPGPGRRSLTVEHRTGATVAQVWPLVGEAARWREWSFLSRSGLEREGDPPPDGVGARRRFTRYGMGSTEEVLAWDPPSHLAYTVVRGFPVRDYRADVHLVPDGDGTLIRWSATYSGIVGVADGVTGTALRRLLTRFARDLARYAERA